MALLIVALVVVPVVWFYYTQWFRFRELADIPGPARV
jgi:hypothetical protein